MNNYDKIKAAYDMGYAAVIDKSFYVTSISMEFKYISVTYIGSKRPRLITFTEIEYDKIFDKITGFLYAGELLGSGKIPEGQRFKEKKTGDILMFDKNTMSVGLIRVSGLTKAGGRFLGTIYKSEIEPYFD